MKILIAPDSFKESLNAVDAAQAIDAGVKLALPHAETVLLPIADGGEGTVTTLVSALGGKYIDSQVQGPLGQPIRARWGLLTGDTAVIETAAASGLALLAPGERNPLLASTFGTGQLLLAALQRGCRRIILGLGGSATVDGGAGALAALGADLLDANGRKITPNAQGLLALASINTANVDPGLKRARIEIAADVDNTLLGPRGAAKVFGPQKGATPSQVAVLEQALARLAAVAENQFGKDIAAFAGSGAAGGLAAGLQLIAPVSVRSGITLILEALDFAGHLAGADLILTGEGQIDSQSAMGKALGGIAGLAKEKSVPLIAFCGALGPGYQAVYPLGVTAIQPIVPGPMPLEQALKQGALLLTAAAERGLRLFLAGRS